jgi:hypothetical protein
MPITFKLLSGKGVEMKYINVRTAIQEARSFVEKAEELVNLTDELGENNLGTTVQGSLSASVRRKSLDLTKSLSKMRKSDWEE